MKLIPFNCQKADQEYKNFYNQYGGSSIPIFSGAKTQIGYGLGGIFGSLLKAALPVIKRGATSLGKTAIKTGINIAKDGLSGKNIKQAVSKNLKEAGKDVLSDSLSGISNFLSPPKNTSKSNKRKRHNANQSISPKRVKRRRANKSQRSKDIFG